MQSMWLNLLVMIVRKLIDPQLWEQVSARVKEAEQFDTMPGEEKRGWVVSQITYGADWMVNLAIEVAVTVLRLK